MDTVVGFVMLFALWGAFTAKTGGAPTFFFRVFVILFVTAAIVTHV